MEKRLKFKCWKCERTYTLFRKITDEQVLAVACPYCNAEGVVDLKPYRNGTTQVFRNLSLFSPSGELTLGDELALPDILPTQSTEQ